MPDRKLWDIDHPPVVVLAGEPVRPDLEETLRERTTHRIERVETDATLARLEERPPADCLWVTATSESTGLETVEAARSMDHAVAIALAPSEAVDSTRLASDATAAGANEYVGADESVDACADRIERAIDRAVDRRNHGLKSDVLDVMLSSFEQSLYAKDDEARHVLYTEQDEGPSPADVFGKTDVEAYTSQNDTLEKAYEDDLQILETGEPVYERLEQHTYGTEQHWTVTTKVPWPGPTAEPVDGAVDPDHVRGIVGVSVDVTEFKRRARDLLTRIARLKQYPDFVTHDLKNPLQLATGYLDLAKAGDEESFAEVEAALERMEKLIEDFKAIANQERSAPETVEPTPVVPLVDRLWRTAATETATLDNGFDEETHVVANEIHFRPLLENLLKNACIHGGEGVTVRIGPLEDGFYLEDDGPGIPESKREDAFEYGYTTAEQGTGIGLSIVREAVATHDWSCTVTESEDGGARFEIRDCLIGTDPGSEAVGETLSLDRFDDVGPVSAPGESSAEPALGRYELCGRGENVWGDTNEFAFRYRLLEDDVRIVGRLASFDAPAEYSKAALMVRDDLDPEATYAAVGITRDHGPELLWRASTGEPGRSAQFAEPGAFEWFRLERVDECIYAAVSSGGSEWRVVDSRPIPLAGRIAVGCLVCSTDPERDCEAIFEDVDVTAIRAADGATGGTTCAGRTEAESN